MYAKLFARIAQSSLMEEKVTTRYIFMMMLALADRHGDVIGTDVAIARMMNVKLDEFMAEITPLLSPDPDSNSQEEEGRRLVPSENGRGYRVVNYGCYRDMKSDEEKREYMRNYMRERRASKLTVKPVNFCKTVSSDVTHTEAEAEADKKTIATSGNVVSKKTTIPFQKPLFAQLVENGKQFRPVFTEQECTAFLKYYNDKDWKVGNRPMRSWKRTQEDWHKRKCEKLNLDPKNGTRLLTERFKDADPDTGLRKTTETFQNIDPQTGARSLNEQFNFQKNGLKLRPFD